MFTHVRKRKWSYHALLLTGAFALSACSNESQTMNHIGHDMGIKTPEAATPVLFEVLRGNTFTLTAKESTLHLNDQIMKNVWTYNGTVPGPQRRVKQGEQIKVVLINELTEPVTIHWHGLPVPNNMDGIPGVTQNAVKPNESFTYEFTASVAGTYWYHSHQKSAEQFDKGLYGSLVVESTTPDPAPAD